MKFLFEERTSTGTREAKRIRRQGGIPAVLYGKGAPTTSVTIDRSEFERVYRAGEHAVTGSLSDQEELFLIQEVQLDPLGDDILHVDLRRVDKDETVRVLVAIETIGSPKAGILDHMMVDIEVECLPHQIPDHIELKVGEMVIGDILRVSDIPYPEGVEPAAEPGLPVLALHAPKGEDEPEEGEVVEDGPEEPERIGGEKKDGDDS